MSNWVLTKGMAHLRTSFNIWSPGRDKTSDGTIGDAAHIAEAASSHNPDDTSGSHAEWNDHDGIAEVRADDIDVNFRNGVSAQAVVNHIIALPGVSKVLRYVIYNRKIYEADNGWKPRAYTGASAHTEHIHFTGAFTEAADNNSTFNYRLDELGDDVTPQDKQDIIDGVVAALTATTPLKDDGGKEDGTFNTPIGKAALGNGIPDSTLPKDKYGDYPRQPAWVVIQHIGEVVKDLNATIGKQTYPPAPGA
jgi:hypothetical protein